MPHKAIEHTQKNMQRIIWQLATAIDHKKYLYPGVFLSVLKKVPRASNFPHPGGVRNWVILALLLCETDVAIFLAV